MVCFCYYCFRSYSCSTYLAFIIASVSFVDIVFLCDFFCIIAFLVKCFFWRQVSYSFFLARQVRLFSPIINEFYLQEKCVFCNFSTIIALVIFLQRHDEKKRIKQIIQWSPFMLLLYWLYHWGVTLRTCGLLLDSILKNWSPKISFFSSCLLLQYYLHHLFGAWAYLEKWENFYIQNNFDQCHITLWRQTEKQGNNKEPVQISNMTRLVTCLFTRQNSQFY